MRPPASLDTRLYQAALYLYPPAFRREFSPEMVRDFDEARHDAQLVGHQRGLWAFRAHMSTDLASTVVLQWLRTGLPIIVVISVAASLLAASSLAKFWPRRLFMLPSGTPDTDVMALTLLAAIVVLVIAATIIFTVWFTRPIRHRGRIEWSVLDESVLPGSVTADHDVHRRARRVRRETIR